MSSPVEKLQVASLFAVNDIVAVVTGGIGRMMTEALAVNGARKVYILGRRLEVLMECASRFPEIIVPLECDVSSKESLQSCADVVAAEVGFVNLLVCNAGAGGPETTRLNASSTLDEFVESQWEHSVSSFTDTFKTNTVGYWYTTLAFLKLLDQGNQEGNVSQRSQVVATCSTLGFSRLAPTGRFAYGQSKAASTHLMRQLSTSLVPYGIRTNMIAPGLFPTDMTSVMMSSVGAYKAAQGIPEGRPGRKEDMAGVILFLASKAGAYLNGNILLCDGGRLAVVPGSY
ncbi:putative short-chain dehydrogenase [Dactylonectria macrodidyma]|uniref:Short-chain dehydrogenase n=1 Tax=Dactylonectria macrodidyma TaxID=307937 RepID=A0A9P9DM81_9HYPO|nr:putative short-chain dehydrogenase [Dactylonectria macrodidyma]